MTMVITLAWALTLPVAAAFLVATVGKLRDPVGFARALRGLPARFRTAVPALELVLAAGLAQPWRPLRDLTALAAIGVLGGFTAYLAANPQLDDEGGCRCFGAVGTSTRAGIARNVALAAVLTVAVALGPIGWRAALPAAVALAVLGHLGTGYLLTGRLLTGRLVTGLPTRPARPRGGGPAAVAVPELADPQRQTMLVFLEPGCTACEQVRALLPGWRADPDGPRVVAVEDPATLDRFDVDVTPSAAVLDRDGRQVDGNGRPSAERAVGVAAVRARHRIAVQGHDLPLDPAADRTLLVFLRRGDEPPELPVENGLSVVVLSPQRLRHRLPVPVTHDPGDRLASLFGVTATPSAVLLDRRGNRLPAADVRARGLATLLQPPPA